MKDNLEDFIQNNRASFDSSEPDDKNWELINKKLGAEKRAKVISLPMFWRVAAVVTLLLATVFVFKYNRPQPPQQTIVQAENTTDLEEVEAYYTSMIVEKKAEIESFGKDYILNLEAEDGLQKLDSMYTFLKTEMKQKQNEQVMNAMIRNLQLRINILNQQLIILENVKKLKTNKQNENVSI